MLRAEIIDTSYEQVKTIDLSDLYQPCL